MTFTIIGTALLKAWITQLVKEKDTGQCSSGSFLLPTVKWKILWGA